MQLLIAKIAASTVNINAAVHIHLHDARCADCGEDLQSDSVCVGTAFMTIRSSTHGMSGHPRICAPTRALTYHRYKKCHKHVPGVFRVPIF